MRESPVGVVSLGLSLQNDNLASNLFLQSRSSHALRPRTDRVHTTFPRLLLDHAQRAARRAGAAREGLRHLADARPGASWRALVRALACGLAAAGPAARRAPGRRRREPAAPVRGDAGGAVARRDAGAAVPGRGGRRVRVPDRQRRGRASRSSKTRSRSTSCSRCAPQCPQLARIWYDDPRGLRNYSEPGLRVARRADRRGPRLRRRAPGLLRRRGRARRSPTTSPRCSSPRARPATPRAWCTRTRPCIDRAAAGARFDKLDRRRRGAGLPAAGLDRPEHLLATRSGWPAATSSTAPSRRAR